ncbi:acetyl-CoA carboxylase biotin carboxyl carrier protein [Campylobacter sp. MG1]|uniref:acetyl-CoA carboxylase biotin carboxyl carrier protein n=1 Tax=Campylobacter sp. MG1 TaxID=2976332 RepID=UPI00226CC0C4|nr:acetyl-CoA carboxylase biotin carboxyl carrier protein [Campylobacter sp. MG1]
MKREEIKELIDMFAQANIGKIKIKEGDFEISLEKQGTTVECAPVPVVPQAAPTPINVNVVNEAKPSKNHQAITSPMVGTFYQAPSPGAATFVKAGQSVRKGDTICIIEAMKIMNEIEAEFDCKIVNILIEDGQPVEYGTELFEIEKL